VIAKEKFAVVMGLVDLTPFESSLHQLTRFCFSLGAYYWYSTKKHYIPVVIDLKMKLYTLIHHIVIT
jgi:hypothetical protein